MTEQNNAVRTITSESDLDLTDTNCGHFEIIGSIALESLQRFKKIISLKIIYPALTDLKPLAALTNLSKIDLSGSKSLQVVLKV